MHAGLADARLGHAVGLAHQGWFHGCIPRPFRPADGVAERLVFPVNNRERNRWRVAQGRFRTSQPVAADGLGLALEHRLGENAGLVAEPGDRPAGFSVLASFISHLALSFVVDPSRGDRGDEKSPARFPARAHFLSVNFMNNSF
jgi:hypothetical protein